MIRRSHDIEMMRLAGVRAVSTRSTRTTPVKSTSKQGRNELCACGSGRKYKKCHGA